MADLLKAVGLAPYHQELDEVERLAKAADEIFGELQWGSTMNAGTTFLAPSLDDHLWMVISDASLDPSRVVVVSFLSWTPRLDQTCIVKARAFSIPKRAPFRLRRFSAWWPTARRY